MVKKVRYFFSFLNYLHENLKKHEIYYNNNLVAFLREKTYFY